VWSSATKTHHKMAEIGGSSLHSTAPYRPFPDFPDSLLGDCEEQRLRSGHSVPHEAAHRNEARLAGWRRAYIQDPRLRKLFRSRMLRPNRKPGGGTIVSSRGSQSYYVVDGLLFDNLIRDSSRWVFVGVPP
jgi:hypothetical protein